MADTVPGSLDAIHDRLDQGEERMRRIENTLDINTQLTAGMATTVQEIRDFQTAGRVARKVLIWSSGLAGSLAVLWHFAKDVWAMK